MADLNSWSECLFFSACYYTTGLFPYWKGWRLPFRLPGTPNLKVHGSYRSLLLSNTVHSSVGGKLCLLLLYLGPINELFSWALGLWEGGKAVWCLSKSLWSVCVVYLLQGRRGMRDRRGGESQRRTRAQCKLSSASLLLWTLFFLKRALTCRNQPHNIFKG